MFLLWLPWLAYAGMIFFLSSIPGDGFPRITLGKGILPDFIADNPDKVVHMGLYAILTWLAFRAMTIRHPGRIFRAMWVAVLLSSAYGASDEFHQRFTPHRSCDVYDWVADTVGAILGVLVCYWIYSKRARAASRPL